MLALLLLSVGAALDSAATAPTTGARPAPPQLKSKHLLTALRGGGSPATSIIGAVDALLMGTGLSRLDLPSDMMAALLAGQLSPQVLRNYGRLLREPFFRSASNLLLRSPFVRNRLILDPDLAIVLLVETALVVATKMVAEGNAGLGKLVGKVDFIAANLALLVIANIALVVALAPRARLGKPPTGVRRALASLPASFLQAGSFTATQRLTCLIVRTVQLGLIGAASSVFRSCVARAILEARTRITGRKDISASELEPIWSTALTNGAFVGVSISTRYQLVNAVEEWLLPKGPIGICMSAVLRCANHLVGIIMWETWMHFRRS
ncbi:hypothetical protein T492DRAFT_970114 [Pavlovales sp. CCMP2436]|nr:hypothetical protein T492DRAFT_970114 [Pavlovales sp. CCMP2436]